MSTTRRRVAILLASTLVLMFGLQRGGFSKPKRISRRPERWHAGRTSLPLPRARPVTKAQRRGRGLVQSVLHRGRPMLASVTSISTKDNVKNLPTIPGKERNARVEQISSDHPWRSNQARAQRPEKNAGRYPDDQRGDHDQNPNQSQQRCESPGSPDAGSEPFLTRNAHAQERQNNTPYYDSPKCDVEKPLYTL